MSERWMPACWPDGWPPNVWLGTTVEDQETADERIPHLLRVPAAVRFLSCEPLLEAVDLRMGGILDLWDGNPDTTVPKLTESDRRRDMLHWVIVGGESGGGARPFNLAWARALRDQCRAAGVACFIKQLGAHPITQPNGKDPGPRRLKLADRKGGAMVEWPRDLCVREVPRP